jgi:hypothetical protein
MNKHLRIFTVAAALCTGLAFTATAAEEKHEHKDGDKHEHAHKNLGGPNGGRLLETEPHAEFFVEKDRSVTVRFFSDDLKPVTVGDQTVIVLAEPKSGKTKLEFEKSGDALKSKAKLPEGDDYNLVVQVRAKPDAKPQNFRFKLDLSTCGECKRAEYACICEH